MKKLHVLFVIAFVSLMSITVNAQWEYIGYGGSVFAQDSMVILTSVEHGGIVSISHNEGTTWRIIPELDGSVVHSPVISGENIFAAAIGIYRSTDGIYRSTDLGKNWQIMNAEFTANCLVLTDSFLVAGTVTGIYFSSNSGRNWMAIDNELSGSNVTHLKRSGTVLVAGIDRGLGIYVSRDFGRTWQCKTDGPGAHLSILDLAVSDSNIFFKGFLHPATSQPFEYIYRSSNFGEDWSTVENFGRNSSMVLGMLYAEGTVFLGTLDAVVFSTDSGLSWQKLVGDLLDGKTFAVSKNYLIAATVDSTFRFPRFKITDVPPQSDPPTDFNLNQNYPNPFNPSTAISYSLPKSSFVTLKIYDILGKEVTLLVNEEKAEGKYSVNFDGNKLASGTYLCRLVSGAFSQTKKMILMK